MRLSFSPRARRANRYPALTALELLPEERSLDVVSREAQRPLVERSRPPGVSDLFIQLSIRGWEQVVPREALPILYAVHGLEARATVPAFGGCTTTTLSWQTRF